MSAAPKKKFLIVEDEFIVANDLRLMLLRAGHEVCGIASSVAQARRNMEVKDPDWLLLDVRLAGEKTGIDLGAELNRERIPFLYISANTNQSTLEAAKATQPYGFLVKPFRERDLLVMLDIALYRHDLETGRIEGASRHQIPDDCFDGIIGQSDSLKAALDKTRIVAPTDTSVLITGESGTGKEGIAMAIHNCSGRRNRHMVKVNCAALPMSLIESELFGHERGAFTGALTKRIGKFEQAADGTLFLDEIGELPLEAQVKLLRALQEKEIERLGSNEVIRTNVRIIAATNRNLECEVAEGRFRLDLYYRLNVFPVELPPLRDRLEDIPVLAEHFLKQYSEKTHRRILRIGDNAMRQLQAYNWPGNIRELEHLIERNVLLAEGDAITHFEMPVIRSGPVLHGSGTIKTMEEMEREHILNALKSCNGRVSGEGGAAQILNLPAATLYSKIKKLGIKQGYQ